MRPFYKPIVILTATLDGDAQGKRNDSLQKLSFFSAVAIIVSFEQTSYDVVEGEEVNRCVEVISPDDIGSTEIYVEVISVETTAENRASK